MHLSPRRARSHVHARAPQVSDLLERLFDRLDQLADLHSVRKVLPGRMRGGHRNARRNEPAPPG